MRVDDEDEELVTVITQTAFEVVGVTLAQSKENEPGEDTPAPPQSPNTT